MQLPPPAPDQSTYAARRERLRALLAERNLDAAVVTSSVNVRYLSGLQSSNAALLVTARGADVLATDGRYAEVARGLGPELLEGRAVARLLTERAVGAGARRLGRETHVMSVDDAAALESDGVEWQSLARAVESPRLVKDETEVELLRTACRITDAALVALRGEVRTGQTERDLARRLEALFREHGGDGPAFASIVAGGPNSAVPHHEPGDRPLQAGDLLKVDCGARYAGYCADTTRTWVVGRQPADWQREVHAVVRAAQDAGSAALVDGADVREVDAAARRTVHDAGYGEAFVHGLGHGVGLEVHEAPLLAATGEGRLSPRVPVTVEPGIYLPGRGGCRVEDVFLVRAGSGPHQLTSTEKDLVPVGC